MRVIGITGGVGSGKSEVMNYIGRNYEAAIIRADDAAHYLMQPGQACYTPVGKLLGPGFTDECGNLDRKKMSAVIFKDENMRKSINAIVHPAVKKYIKDAIIREQREGTPYLFIEAALLIEDKYDEICDELWYIYADEQIRRKRLIHERGYSVHKIDEIMASQLSEEEFSRHCNFEIDNSGDMENTIAQINQRMGTYEIL